MCEMLLTFLLAKNELAKRGGGGERGVVCGSVCIFGGGTITSIAHNWAKRADSQSERLQVKKRKKTRTKSKLQVSFKQLKAAQVEEL